MMQRILDQLVEGVVDGPEDLMGIGECLNLLDKLEECEGFPKARCSDLAVVRKLFNRLILEDSPDPQADWEEIRRRMTALHEDPEGGTPECEAAPARPDVDWQNIERLVDDLTPAPPAESAVDLLDIGDGCTPATSPEHDSSETTEIQDPRTAEGLHRGSAGTPVRHRI